MVVVTPWTTKLPLMVTVPVLISCPIGSIVNEEGTYKLDPPNVTLPDISKLLENLVAPTTFKLPLISILVALISVIYALLHDKLEEPKL